MTPTGTPQISVALATHNRVANLARILPPLLADPATAEVVVVADGCTDGTAEQLTRMARHEPKLRPVIVEQQSGRIRARHLAVERASHAAVLLLDDDVVAEPGLVSGHAAHQHAANRPVVVVGSMPTIVPSPAPSGSFSTVLYSRGYERHVAEWTAHPEGILIDLWGGNVSYPRDCYLAVDASRHWAEDSYHDDKYYGIMLHRQGLDAVFDRSLRAVHLHSRTLEASLRDWELQGRDWVVLHRSNPDLLGDVDLEQFTTALPRPLDALVRASDHRVAYRILRRIGEGLVRLGARFRMFWLELRAGQFLRRVVIRHAAACELRGGASATGAPSA
jgi:glycosyltransferase involved in cell wall biosynthesis